MKVCEWKSPRERVSTCFGTRSLSELPVGIENLYAHESLTFASSTVRKLHKKMISFKTLNPHVRLLKTYIERQRVSEVDFDYAIFWLFCGRTRTYEREKESV
jgi:hypothetical protein